MVRLRVLALVGPLVFYVLMWCVTLSWVEILPNPVAVQWGSTGVTNTNSLVSFYGLFAAGVVVPGAVGFLATITSDRGARRVCTGLAVMLSVVLSGMPMVIVSGQRHLPDASASSVHLAAMGIVAAIGVGLGIAAGYLVDPAVAGDEKSEETLESRYRLQWRSGQ
ncbi:hypothetical protein B2J88_44925 [Rhodococcus sp. SRB_17]|nr:hypothetical protein [Rhodococcus sp. SRB_17]